MSERKGKKLRRISNDSKAYYKLQFGTTDDNKRKSLEHQIRCFPEDVQALKLYRAKYPNKNPPAPGKSALARERKLLAAKRKAA